MGFWCVWCGVVGGVGLTPKETILHALPKFKPLFLLALWRWLALLCLDLWRFVGVGWRVEVVQLCKVYTLKNDAFVVSWQTDLELFIKLFT